MSTTNIDKPSSSEMVVSIFFWISFGKMDIYIYIWWPTTFSKNCDCVPLNHWKNHGSSKPGRNDGGPIADDGAALLVLQTGKWSETGRNERDPTISYIYIYIYNYIYICLTLANAPKVSGLLGVSLASSSFWLWVNVVVVVVVVVVVNCFQVEIFAIPILLLKIPMRVSRSNKRGTFPNWGMVINRFGS